jgi:hypothetical protein
MSFINTVFFTLFYDDEYLFIYLLYYTHAFNVLPVYQYQGHKLERKSGGYSN